MPDSDQMEQESVQQATAAPVAPVVKRPSMFRDPVVRALAILAGLLVVLYLVTVVSALVMGLMNPTEPRTRGERDLQYFELAAMQDPANAKVWRDYIDSLMATRQYMKAQSVIDQAAAAIDQSGTQDIAYAQARLYLATKKYDQAITSADELREKLKKYHDAAKKKRDSPESKGQEINENYYGALLVKAEAFEALEDPEQALESLDAYLERYETAADILIWRGEIRASTGDTEGAEEDFQAALQFLPNDPNALDGLEKIGAEQ